jgi:hypothetical protein
VIRIADIGMAHSAARTGLARSGSP